MFTRLLQLVIRSYVRGPARSWIYTSAAAIAMNLLRRMFSRKALVDVSDIEPGEMFVIEILPISHREQIKRFKKAERRAKKAAKEQRRAARRGGTGRIPQSGSGRERHSA